MDWIILYITAFLLVIAVLGIGVLINSQARSCFNSHKNDINSKGLTAKEFSNILFEHNKLRNINLISLKAKKTNYYSAKYNVIKVSPEVANSNYLFDLAICAKCTNNATNQQYKYISATFKLFFLTLTKFVYIAFIPTIFISAILNITFGLEKLAFIITLASIILYTLSFIIQLILYIFQQFSVNKIVENIKKLNLLEENELKNLGILITALNKFEFFELTRLTLKMFSPLSPGLIFDKGQKDI